MDSLGCLSKDYYYQNYLLVNFIIKKIKKYNLFIIMIQSTSGGKVNISGGQKIGHCKKKNIYIYWNGYRELLLILIKKKKVVG